ncbi:cell wall metabolism sensor histidine kinase WalK [Sphingosinicella sp. CPCC 101087]|uniref:sensor histidine kinase n=1 Tax=Sphingosinicella sp. CPCC 101087 TaxID=2497754 RepID=UPI00101C3B99|nr:HAMP domain-containing sensor histidine kinase [Sphingosinicella sp. CPCC 101087]
MKRFLPKSLIGQIALVMAAAMLMAQAINFTLILSERQRVSRAQREGPAISRFVTYAQRAAPLNASEREILLPRLGRRSRLWADDSSAVAAGASDRHLVDRLRESAAQAGLAVREVRATTDDDVRLPRHVRMRVSPDQGQRIERRMDRLRILILSVQLPDGAWINARMITSRPDPWLAARPLAATLLTYLIILAAMVWVAARLARPLRDLTAAAERFQGRGEALHVEPRGPADLARAIRAFNAMGERVSAMLDEKDRMLGAIGHDLRTPLASLRIRAESVEPEEERLRMIATIEEMTAMLDDTLALARSGRAVEPPRIVDLSALADAVVEEFRALGHDVEMEPGGRVTGRVQPNLLRRAIRNLIENAVKYGGSARVAVLGAGPEPGTDESIAIEISDRGPGIDPSELSRVQEAFYRVEPSRSRETGGSGLGLTLARAAAQAHGGTLELENRSEGGLLARLRLPKDGIGDPPS